MNSLDLLSDAPLPPGDPREHRLFCRLLLNYLADHVHRAELANGCGVRDATDFEMWLRELAAEAAKLGGIRQSTEISNQTVSRPCQKVTAPEPQKRWEDAT